MRTVTKDSMQSIIMESSTKKYMLTSEANLWVMWKQDSSGDYEINEIFLKSGGVSRYDDKNEAIRKVVMLDMVEQAQASGPNTSAGFNGA